MGLWNRKKAEDEASSQEAENTAETNAGASAATPDTRTNPNGPASLLDLTRLWMEGDGWQTQPHPDRDDSLTSGFDGDNGSYPICVQVREDLHQFFCYGLYPENIPEELRQRAADFVARANYGMRIGNFEIDMDDGEVRYKSSFDFENERLTGNLIKNALYPALSTLDRYAPALKALVEKRLTAKEAIAMIEENDSSTDDAEAGSFDPLA